MPIKAPLPQLNRWSQSPDFLAGGRIRHVWVDPAKKTEYQGPEPNHEKSRFSHTKTMFFAREHQVFDGPCGAGVGRTSTSPQRCDPPASAPTTAASAFGAEPVVGGKPWDKHWDSL